MIYRLLAYSLIFASLSLNAQTVTWYGEGETGRQEQQEVYNGPQTGFATFYAAYLAGQPTAYGETYQPTEMTASHANLPMGTLLKVTRLDNGASVEVRVNDRGGLCNGCVIVLSQSAARAISLMQTGRSQVRIEKVGFSNWNPQAPAINTNSPRVATRTIEDRRMSWESELARNDAPSPTEDPYAYQPATYGNNRVVNPNSAPAYPQQQAVYNPPAAPTTANRGRVVRPQQQTTANDRTQQTVARTVNNQAQNNREQEFAVLSPGGAQQQARNPLADRELQPGYRTTDNSPSTYNSAVVTPPATNQGTVSYMTYPNTTGALTNRVIVPTETTTAANQPLYAVQVGAYGNRANADRMAANLRSRGLTSVHVRSTEGANGTVINRVVVGQFSDATVAKQAADNMLQTHSLSGVVRSF